MSEYFHSRYDQLVPYTPGEQPMDRQYVKLNTNESPFPPAPGVIAAIDAAEVSQLNLYSDPELRPLKQAIAKAYDVEVKNVFVGNGSDECLNFAFMSYGEDGIAYPEISYDFYSVFAALHGIKAEERPLQADFTIDSRDYRNLGKTVVIANPNAPTGLALPLDEIEEIVRSNEGHVVIIDEAYVDFGTESAVKLTKRYENLLVVQTFSKSRSLAGSRVGFAIGNEALIGDLETIKFSTNPYNVNRLSMKAAEEAVKDTAYFEKTRAAVMETRAYTIQALKERGFDCPDSKTNFVFVRTDRMEGGALQKALKAHGVLVRHFSNPRISDYNRISIGSREDMDALLRALDEILG